MGITKGIKKKKVFNQEKFLLNQHDIADGQNLHYIVPYWTAKVAKLHSSLLNS